MKGSRKLSMEGQHDDSTMDRNPDRVSHVSNTGDHDRLARNHKGRMVSFPCWQGAHEPVGDHVGNPHARYSFELLPTVSGQANHLPVLVRDPQHCANRIRGHDHPRTTQTQQGLAF